MDKVQGELEYQLSKSRKRDHLSNCLKSQHSERNFLDDMLLMNNSLPEFNLSEVDTSCVFLDRESDYPIMINAITGGYPEAISINRSLALLARKFNIPMAVGSQSMGIKYNQEESYKIVREIMKEQTVIANVSANSSLERVKLAVEMIEADGIQLHLNVPQELCMKEGDRDFKGVIDNIEDIINNSPVPVIIKEVGFGISKNVAQRLFDVGIRYLDVGGKGGTNFIEIEDLRNDEMDFSDLYSWGIPTPLSLIECNDISPQLNLIATGGIRKAEDVVKTLCLGSQMVGISGIVLNELLKNDYEKAENFLKEFLYKIKIIMIMIGAKNLEEISHVDYRVFGQLKSLVEGKSLKMGR